jgi:hypothetical protein
MDRQCVMTTATTTCDRGVKESFIRGGMGYNDVIIGDVYDVWVGVTCVVQLLKNYRHTHPTKPQKLLL